jgi:RimJ/RimL family protein N-acetyltransferase
MKLGFSEEGLLRGHVERDGERRDCRLFGLLL